MNDNKDYDLAADEDAAGGFSKAEIQRLEEFAKDLNEWRKRFVKEKSRAPVHARLEKEE